MEEMRVEIFKTSYMNYFKFLFGRKLKVLHLLNKEIFIQSSNKMFEYKYMIIKFLNKRIHSLKKQKF
jgi:hypothetical protein